MYPSPNLHVMLQKIQPSAMYDTLQKKKVKYLS